MIQEPLTVRFKWLENGNGLEVPAAQSAGAAGLDLCAATDKNQEFLIQPGEYRAVPCGFALELPAGFEAQIRPRSGLAFKFGVTVLNAPGTIDADYRGEIKVLLVNHGKQDFAVKRGDRIAQMIVAPVVGVTFEPHQDLADSVRGAKGFGSTGISQKGI